MKSKEKPINWPVIAISVAVCLVSIACGKEDAAKGSYKSSYQLAQNGCSTGEHSFSASSQDEAKKQMCDALQNDELNNYCSRSLRQDHFRQNCSGLNWTGG